MNVCVKICGLTTEDAARAASDADYIGFIFYPPSPRNVSAEKAADLAMLSEAKKVAVMVNPTDDFLNSLLAVFMPDVLQLHGQESPARVQEIKERYKLPVIKAINIATPDDLVAIGPYQDVADMLLLDAKTSGHLPGGMGKTFDWKILKDFISVRPWFLSGGLDADNVEEAVRVSGAKLVDVSSRLESSPGIKDRARIRAFIDKVRSIA